MSQQSDIESCLEDIAGMAPLSERERRIAEMIGVATADCCGLDGLPENRYGDWSLAAVEGYLEIYPDERPSTLAEVKP